MGDLFYRLGANNLMVVHVHGDYMEKFASNKSTLMLSLQSCQNSEAVRDQAHTARVRWLWWTGFENLLCPPHSAVDSLSPQQGELIKCLSIYIKL